jgi:hypothetical protein
MINDPECAEVRGYQFGDFCDDGEIYGELDSGLLTCRIGTENNSQIEKLKYRTERSSLRAANLHQMTSSLLLMRRSNLRKHIFTRTLNCES